MANNLKVSNLYVEEKMSSIKILNQNTNFHGNGLPLLIGSLPLRDHDEAIDLVFQHTPEIPGWVQLPTNRQEAMMVQFTPEFPGSQIQSETVYVDTDSDHFQNDLLKLYEDYVAVAEEESNLDNSRFNLKQDSARGFFVLLERLENISRPPMAIKGQITGPFTLTTGIHDQNRRAIFYDEQLRDAAVKLLAMQAR